MPYAIIRNGTPEQVSGAFTDNAGTKHPANVLALWSDAELAAIDVRPITEPFDIPAGSVAVGSTLEWDGSTVTRVWTLEDYVAPVPTSVTMRQARLALSRAGHLANAETAIAGMTGQAGEEARIEWEYATTLRRDHQLVVDLGPALGLEPADLDDLFRQAATI